MIHPSTTGTRHARRPPPSRGSSTGRGRVHSARELCSARFSARGSGERGSVAGAMVASQLALLEAMPRLQELEAELRGPAFCFARESGDVVEPSSAGWRYLSFDVERLGDGDEATRRNKGEEVAYRSGWTLRCPRERGPTWELGGRARVDLTAAGLLSLFQLHYTLWETPRSRLSERALGDGAPRARRRLSRSRCCGSATRRGTDQPHPQA